jgi:hypothetical protein
MASAAQIAANRKNAQKSTGPVTPEGKAKASRNSIRHGILSRVIPMDALGYRELLDGLYTSLTPQNELQRMMVDQIAITTMRLRRIWGAEQNYLYTKAGWQDGPDSNQATVHNFLEVPTAVTYLRYESMLNRLLNRLLRQYRAIRSDESWVKISQSDSPYIQQEEVAEQPAEEAPTEQQAAAVEECSTESDESSETEQVSLWTIGSDTDARIAALPKIPYNEYAVQSRVAAYDARQRRYGTQ